MLAPAARKLAWSPLAQTCELENVGGRPDAILNVAFLFAGHFNAETHVPGNRHVRIKRIGFRVASRERLSTGTNLRSTHSKAPNTRT